MKKFWIFLLIFFSFVWISCSKITEYFQDPVTYNDNVIDIYNSIIDDYDAYDTYYIETSSEYFYKIEEKRVSTIESIQVKISELEMIWPFKDDSALLDAAVDASEKIVFILQEHDKKLLDLWEEYMNEEISEEKYNDESEKVFDESSQVWEELSENLDTVQTAFASKYNYELSDLEY